MHGGRVPLVTLATDPLHHGLRSCRRSWFSPTGADMASSDWIIIQSALFRRIDAAFAGLWPHGRCPHGWTQGSSIPLSLCGVKENVILSAGHYAGHGFVETLSRMDQLDLAFRRGKGGSPSLVGEQAAGQPTLARYRRIKGG